MLIFGSGSNYKTSKGISFSMLSFMDSKSIRFDLIMGSN